MSLDGRSVTKQYLTIVFESVNEPAAEAVDVESKNKENKNNTILSSCEPRRGALVGKKWEATEMEDSRVERNQGGHQIEEGNAVRTQWLGG
jgi:hypothetical protein